MQGLIVCNGIVELVDDLEVRPPEPHEVSVRVLASGLCRSDLILIHEPSPNATVLGHEAAGVIDAVGAEVTGLHIGQMVAVTCPVPCNACEECSRGRYTACLASFGIGLAPFTRRGKPVQSLARVSSLAERITVDSFQVHPVSNLTAASAALIGCAVSTGYGMIKNVAELKAGETVVVAGVGGIGINSIQTAALLGASRIVAVDINATKDTVAAEFGATDFVAILPEDQPSEIIQKIRMATASKFDAFIDTTGQPTVIEAGQHLLKPGGRLALVGMPRQGTTAAIDINAAMYSHICVRGALNGATDPYHDTPEIVRLADGGLLNLAGQVSHRWPLARYQEALDALRKGDVVRVVIDIAPPTN